MDNDHNLPTFFVISDAPLRSNLVIGGVSFKQVVAFEHDGDTPTFTVRLRAQGLDSGTFVLIAVDHDGWPNLSTPGWFMIEQVAGGDWQTYDNRSIAATAFDLAAVLAQREAEHQATFH